MLVVGGGMKIDLARYRFRSRGESPPCCRGLVSSYALEPIDKGPSLVLCPTCSRIFVQKRGKLVPISSDKAKSAPKLLTRDPIKGDRIYIPSQLYIDRGWDDVQGGIATVREVKKGKGASKNDLFVSLVEVPGHSYNWSYLRDEQKKLKKVYGRQVARPDPDV